MKAIHPLKRWLFEHQHTLATFGEKVNASASHLSMILSGKKTPSFDLAARIAKATKDAITANDFQAFKQACDKPPRKRRAA
jgi:transcriptional regulator with XRE-family HTH domain